MPGAEALLAFSLAATLLCLAPGPDNLFVLAQSAQHGARAGLLVTLGLSTGLLGHTALVAGGIAIILQTSNVAFWALKMVGAAYLIYLAVQAFKAGTSSAPASVPLSAAALYRRGVIMNLTNPKVALFFLAFLPQFANPDAGEIATQIMVLGGLFIVITLVVFGTVAWLGGVLTRWLRENAAAEQWLNRMAAGVFVALAVRLLITER